MRSIHLSLIVAGALTAAVADSAHAAESASGAYLLGLRGQGAGITPPPGVFFSNQTLIYKGEANANVSLSNGDVGVNVTIKPTVDIPTLLWVTPAEVFGGNLGFGLTVPFGHVDVRATVVPLGAVHDDVFTVADPSLGMFVGWHAGDFHLQTGVTTFIPIGDYQEGEIANLAKHRLAADVYGALTWFNPESGIDFTNIVGVTFNAENEVTDYKTGTEFHWEGSLTKKIGDSFYIGALGYYYNQLTGDSGDGAALGDFKGEVAAIGATVGLDYKLGQTPVSTRIRYYHEFDAINRVEGDAVFLSTSFPLWIDR
ncbi:MAG: transporter [Aestuariivirga sp.]